MATNAASIVTQRSGRRSTLNNSAARKTAARAAASVRNWSCPRNATSASRSSALGGSGHSPHCDHLRRPSRPSQRERVQIEMAAIDHTATWAKIRGRPACPSAARAGLDVDLCSDVTGKSVPNYASVPTSMSPYATPPARQFKHAGRGELPHYRTPGTGKGLNAHNGGPPN